MSEATEREAICAIGQSIFARGLTAVSSGNISVRTDAGRPAALRLVPYFRPGVASAKAVRGSPASTMRYCSPTTTRSSPARTSTRPSTRSKSSRRRPNFVCCCAP